MSELELKMSATVETSSVSWRKRRHQGDQSGELQIKIKRPRYYYYRLASESSKGSEEDTESVYSLQEYETDLARDTTDTDSKSDQEDIELIEYEVASLSENSLCLESSASDTDDQVIFAAAIGAMCDTSLEKWITDGEESDSSSLDNTSINWLGFATCVQCKSINDNPLYRYCEKCFQNRKKLYPPRPRGKQKKKVNNPPVKLDTLKSCLSGLSSLDSGVGSSQECPPLDLDQIVVPDTHLKSGTSITDVSDVFRKDNAPDGHEQELRRKRQASESSLSDFDIKKRKQYRPLSRNSRPSSRNSTKDTFLTLERHQIDENLNKKPVTLSHASTDTCLSQNSNYNLSSSQTSTITSEFSQTSGNSQEISSNTITGIKSSDSISLSSQTCDNVVDVNPNGTDNVDKSELCIICNSAPKNGIFVHMNTAHQCCCYKCAKLTLLTIKRCPICNRSIKKVLKLFTA